MRKSLHKKWNFKNFFIIFGGWQRKGPGLILAPGLELEQQLAPRELK